MTQNVSGHYTPRTSSWRRIATATWGQANDPTIYGTLEVDAGPALAYIEDLRARTGVHVTITHVVCKALADTLAAHPECNAYVRRGRVYEREEVDIFVLVAVSSKERGDARGDQRRAARRQGQRADLTGVKIEDADHRSMLEIARATMRGATEVRRGNDRAFGPVKRLLRAMPPGVIRRALDLFEWLQYDLNLDLSRVGVPKDSFGCAIVTSMGMMGIQHAFAPLIPMARLTCLVAVGAVEERPVARDGEVVIRPVLPITATFDHRIIDGFQAAQLSKSFRERMRDPAKYFGS